MGSTQFSEGHGSHRHIHCKAGQKANSMLVTGLDLSVSDRGFLYHSSAIWQLILFLLSHTVVSVENPVSSPWHWGSQWSPMCPVLLIPGHTPAGQMCAPWGTMGVEPVSPESVQLLAQVSKKWSRKLFFFPVQRGVCGPALQHVAERRSSLFLFNLITGILCC